MSALPTHEEGLALHERLLTDDPTATSDFIVAFLAPLAAFLHHQLPHLDPHLCQEAAEDALLALVKKPTSYNPLRKKLNGYLVMSARGDLNNRLRREKKHQQNRQSFHLVEVDAESGKSLQSEETPILQMIHHEEQRSQREFLERCRRQLSPEEQVCLDLLLQGKGQRAELVAALGWMHLSAAEQELQVKRIKDRVKKRLKRAGGPPL